MGNGRVGLIALIVPECAALSAALPALFAANVSLAATIFLNVL
jgi:hypothetical protein